MRKRGKTARRLRALFVTHTPEFGGAEKHLIELVRRLDESVECRILCYGSDFYSEPLSRRAHLRVVRKEFGRPRSFWAYLAEFVRLDADVAVFVKGIADVFPWFAYVAAYLSGARRVYVIEQLIGDPSPPKVSGHGLSAMVRRAIGWRRRYMTGKWLEGHFPQATICVSEAIRKRLVDEYGYPSDKTITIYNGVDLNHFSGLTHDLDDLKGKLGVKPGEVVLICLARLSSVKRIDLLLQALSSLPIDSGAWKCVIVGGGPLERELKAHASRLKLSSSVIFTGYVADVRPYLQIADLFVLPSDKEGFPHALLEAMAYGLPSVVTDVGGNREALVNHQTGFLTTPGNASELTRSIHYLLVHSEERIRMGEAAKARVQEKFDIEKAMAQFKLMLEVS